MRRIESEEPRIIVTVTGTIARATIARCILGDIRRDVHIGTVRLYPHQISALQQVEECLRDLGGALLCDAVGLGKTYVALAAASSYADVLIVAPAGLRPMWLGALRSTGMKADFISFETLSRSVVPDRPYALVIVDEAHHARNPHTRRYQALASICVSARPLFLTATPLHNSTSDVLSLIALFRGDRAHGLTQEQIAASIVRRDSNASQLTGIPQVQHAPSTVLIDDESILDPILALPPPIPPREAGDAPMLVAQMLVRQWVSSDAALFGALRRRIARATSLEHALEAGRYPTRAELASWVFCDDAVQLAFPELLSAKSFADVSLDEMRVAIRGHLAGLENLCAEMRHQRQADRQIGFVRHITAIHPGAKIVVFSCFGETAAAVYRGLRAEHPAALLTAAGGVVAGGSLTRTETLVRFAPDACAVAHPPVRDAIDLLVTTDLLSEGVNLQDASVVVHLDLPWTAARLEQRIGRVARLRSRHQSVVSYAVHPPPRADAFLRLTRLVHFKATAAANILGPSSGSSAPSHEQSTAAALAATVRIRAVLARWAEAAAPPLTLDPGGRSHTIAATVGTLGGSRHRAIVACTANESPLLLHLNGNGAVTSNACVIADALERAEHPDARAANTGEMAGVLHAVRDWFDRSQARTSAGLDAIVGPRARRSSKRGAIRRADAACAVAPFGARLERSIAASVLHGAASGALPIGLESLLHRDTHQLDVRTMELLHSRLSSRQHGGRDTADDFRVCAVVMFRD